jgi:hypothetical protein
MVKASTASTSELRKAAEMAGAATVQVIISQTSRAGMQEEPALRMAKRDCPKSKGVV